MLGLQAIRGRCAMRCPRKSLKGDVVREFIEMHKLIKKPHFIHGFDAKTSAFRMCLFESLGYGQES
jgi:hypothetical protein